MLLGAGAHGLAGAAGAAEAALHQAQPWHPGPANPPQGTAEPHSQSGRAPVRRKGNTPVQQLWERRVRNLEEQQPCRHQSQCRRKGGDAPGFGAEVSLKPVMQIMEVYGGEDIPCSPWRITHQSRVLERAAAYGEEPMQKQVF